MGLAGRAQPDALLALAFIHHIAIGRNVPLDMAVDWLVSLAPAGVIEFPHKEDPMVQLLLSQRPDIFPDYRNETFANLLSQRPRGQSGAASGPAAARTTTASPTIFRSDGLQRLDQIFGAGRAQRGEFARGCDRFGRILAVVIAVTQLPEKVRCGGGQQMQPGDTLTARLAFQ